MVFQRALQREFAHAAAAVFVALFSILLTTVLVRLLGDAVVGEVPTEALLALIGFGALARLPLVLSLTLFVAILLTLSRAYKDSEMVIWFSAGVPLTRWIGPVLRFAMPPVVVIALGSLVLAPWAERMSEDYRTRFEQRDDAARVSPGVFRESGDASRVFFVEVGAGQSGRLDNVFVSSVEEGVQTVIIAASGAIETNDLGERFVVLEHGRRYEGTPGSAAYRVLGFERYSVRVAQQDHFETRARTRALPLEELMATDTPKARGELASRIGVPVAALLLALLAIPLSFVNPRAGRSSNLIIAVLAYLTYSNTLSIVQAWIARERIVYELGVVLPHLVVLAVLLWLFDRRMRVSPRRWPGRR